MSVTSRPREEVLIPIERARVEIASQFRSTWLAGSVRALRTRGLFDAYFDNLSAESRDAVLSTVAGLWLPASIAVEHYEACERLGLERETIVEIGREVTRFAHGTVLDTAVKLATGVGATPWTLLGQMDRLWRRIWIGGAVGLTKCGPKDARIEIVRWPCARVPYCREAMLGVLQGIVELTARRAYVQTIPGHTSEHSLAYRMAWA